MENPYFGPKGDFIAFFIGHMIKRRFIIDNYHRHFQKLMMGRGNLFS